MKTSTYPPGALVDWQIQSLMEQGFIIGKEEHIQAASLDLALGSRIVQVDTVPPLCSDGFNPKEFFDAFAHKYEDNKADWRKLSKGSVTLMPGAVYVAELQESTNFPKHITAYCNAKSSSGRTDLLLQLIAEGECTFNTISEGRKKLYLVIQTNSFQVRVTEGISLCQLRIFSAKRQLLSVGDYQRLHSMEKLVHGVEPVFNDQGLVLNLDLKKGNLVALNCKKPVDLSHKTAVLHEYFHQRHYSAIGNKPVLILEPNQFLLACTQQMVSVPGTLSAVMMSYSEENGSIISHYAGFIDPGFGLGSPSSVVCEIRNISTGPVSLVHGQQIGFLEFEYNAGSPKALYGASGNNYQGQDDVRFAKYFTK